MKTLFAAAASAFALSGCALEPATHVAQAECKIAPATTRGYAAGLRNAEPVDALKQREAQMRLSTSEYRRSNLARTPGIEGNLLEEALRDCDRALAR